MNLLLLGAGSGGSGGSFDLASIDGYVDKITMLPANLFTSGSRVYVAAKKTPHEAAADYAEHDLGTGDAFIETLFKRTTAGNQVIAAKYQDDENYWRLEIDASNLLHFIAVVATVTKLEITGTTAITTTGRWNYAAFVIDRSVAENTLVYLNGTDDTAGTSTVSTDDVGNTGAMVVGQSGAASIYWNGEISKLRISKPSNVASLGSGTRTVQKLVTSLYNGGNGKFHSQLTATDLADLETISASYDCKEDGQVVTDLLDSSGNGRDLTKQAAELVTNGTFAAALGAEWTLQPEAGTIALDAATLKFTQSGSSEYMHAYQALTLASGSTYTYSATRTAHSATAANNKFFIGGDAPTAGVAVSGAVVDLVDDDGTAGSPETHTGTFVADDTSCFAGIECSDAATETANWDNISLTATYIPSGPGPSVTVITDSEGGNHGAMTNFADQISAFTTDIPDGAHKIVKTDQGSGGNDVTSSGFADFDDAHTPNTPKGTFDPTFFDSSTNAKHGTGSGFPSSGSGVRSSDVAAGVGSGTSVLFDGNDDEITIGATGKNATSITCYVKQAVDNQTLFALQNSTATAVSVAAGVLTFGGSLTGSAIEIDDVSKTAGQAGVILNDNAWHKLKFDLTSVAASNLVLGSDGTNYGNIYLDEFMLNAAGVDGYWKMDEANLRTEGGTEALTFDGDDDLIEVGTVAVGSPLMLNGSAGAIEAWVKWDSSGDNYMRIFDKSDGGLAVNGYSLWVDNLTLSNKIGMQIDDTGFWTSDAVLETDKISHILASWDAAGNVSIYLNAVDVNAVLYSGSATPVPNVETNARIGSWNHDTGREWKGDISVLRIYSAQPTASEVYALYKNGTEPSTPVFKLEMDLAADQLSVPNVEDGLAIDFDSASTEYIALNSAIALSTGAFTLKAWVKPTDLTAAQYIFGSTADANSDGLRIDATTGKLTIVIGGSATVLSTNGVTAGSWNHVAVTRDGSGNLLAYIAGLDDTAGTPSDAGALSINAIGATHSTPATSFNGIMDYPGVWGSALSAADILADKGGTDPGTAADNSYSLDGGPAGPIGDGDPWSVLLTAGRSQIIQPTASLRGTYTAEDANFNDEPTISFNGAQLASCVDALAQQTSAEGTIFIVGKFESGPGADDYFLAVTNDDENDELLAYGSDGTNWAGRHQSGATMNELDSQVADDTSAHIHKLGSNGAAYKHSLDGAASTISASDTDDGDWLEAFVADKLTLGGAVTSDGNVNLGDVTIAAIAIYNKHVSAADEALIIANLESTYGL